MAAETSPRLVERISDRAQELIKKLIGASQPPPRRLKTFLHGTWLGHPLHPLLTDIPIGAWSLAVLFDILWLISPVGNAWAARGAEVLILVGILAALAAAVTGLADWSDTYGAERVTGFRHGLFNLISELVYIVSLALRLIVPSGENGVAATLGFIGFAVMAFAAYLGGDMVFAKGTAVNHTAWEAGSDDFEPVIAVDDMAEKSLTRVMVAGVPVVLLRMGERFFAIAATCSHAGGPLDEGELQGGVVQCPWHGSRFRMSDGKPLTGPATIAQPRYDVRVQDGRILLRRHGT